MGGENLHSADCGFCGLEGPDYFGNYDLVVNPDCPFHAGVDQPTSLSCDSESQDPHA